MKNIKTIINCISFFVCFGIYAQSTITTTGNDLNTVNGSVNYTIGQIVYTTNTSSSSVAQGVQQPYEIQTVLGLSNNNINLEISVFPNPTSNYLNLKITDFKTSNFNYQLFDIQGRLIKSNSINTHNTVIKLENLATSTYFLKVTENQKSIKSFKIIKK